MDKFELKKKFEEFFQYETTAFASLLAKAQNGEDISQSVEYVDTQRFDDFNELLTYLENL